MVESVVVDFFLPTAQGYLLKIHAVPGARQTAVAGLHGDRLKVKVAASPEKGRANEELLSFLARSLKVPLKALHLTSGATSRVISTLTLKLKRRYAMRVSSTAP